MCEGCKQTMEAARLGVEFWLGQHRRLMEENRAMREALLQLALPGYGFKEWVDQTLAKIDSQAMATFEAEWYKANPARNLSQQATAPR
jgi:hypothetical protein